MLFVTITDYYSKILLFGVKTSLVKDVDLAPNSYN